MERGAWCATDIEELGVDVFPGQLCRLEPGRIVGGDVGITPRMGALRHLRERCERWVCEQQAVNSGELVAPRAPCENVGRSQGVTKEQHMGLAS